MEPFLTCRQTSSQKSTELTTWSRYRNSGAGVEDTATPRCRSDPQLHGQAHISHSCPLTCWAEPARAPMFQAPVCGFLVCSNWKRSCWVRDGYPEMGDLLTQAHVPTIIYSGSLEGLDCFSPHCSLSSNHCFSAPWRTEEHCGLLRDSLMTYLGYFTL